MRWYERVRQSTVAAPIGLGATVGLVVVLMLGRLRPDLASSLHRDEAIAWTYASRPIGEIPQALELDVNPPFYFLTLHAWLTAGDGTGEVFLRALSILAILAAAVVAGLTARKAAGPLAGWFAGVFVVATPATLELASLARPYALAYLLGTIVLAAAVWLVLDRPRWAAPTLGIAGGLLVLTHYWGALLLAAVGVGLLGTAALRRDRSLALHTLLGGGLAVLVVVPWLPTFAGQLGSEPLAAHRPPSLWLLDWTLGLAAGGRYVAWAATAMLVGAAVVAYRRRTPGEAWLRPKAWLQADPVRPLLLLTTAAALAAIVAMWSISQMRPLFTSNYALMLAAPLPLLLAVIAGKRPWVVTALVAALAVTVVPDFLRSTTEPIPSRGPEASIAASLERATDPGDVVLLSPGRALAVRYYLGDSRDYLTPIGPVQNGALDFRDRVTRLEATNPADLSDQLRTLPAGTQVAVVRDDGIPWDHPYWIQLDRVMDGVAYQLERDRRMQPTYTGQAPFPYQGVSIDVYRVVPPRVRA